MVSRSYEGSSSMEHIIVYRKIPDQLLEDLQKFCNVSYFEDITEENCREFHQCLETASGLLGSTMLITPELLDRAPNLRVVSNFSAGYENLPLMELTKRGILATNAPDALTDTTADLIFGLLLSTARRIPELDRYIRAKKWRGEISEDLFGLNISHKKIGIIGMGRIGRAVARRASLGFGMKVKYYKRTRDLQAERQFGAKFCELSVLLEKSDFVCLTIPLTPETHHLIGWDELNQMKPTGILINGARGKVIDQEALIQALQDRIILAAGLDVFEEEPLPYHSKLLELDNVVLLPHIGSAVKETRIQMVKLGIENLLQALQGKIPDNLLNPSVLV